MKQKVHFYFVCPHVLKISKFILYKAHISPKFKVSGWKNEEEERKIAFMDLQHKWLS